MKQKQRFISFLLGWLMVATFGYAIALPQLQDDQKFQANGKEKFEFTDMHFDLGPAEKIFGPGGIRVKTQGSAEL